MRRAIFGEECLLSNMVRVNLDGPSLYEMALMAIDFGDVSL